MNSPLVSIIVPVYKVEQFLEKCVCSIMEQTYTNIEIILVDDGSPDNCPQICDKLAEEDCRIKVIHKKNNGVTKARIDGVNASEGEYVFFVDSDDTLEYNAIEELLHCSQKYNADISVCQANILYENKATPQFRNVKYGYYSKDDITHLLGKNFLYDTKTRCSGFPLYLWGKLYKKNLLIDKLETGINFWYGEDMITVFSIMKELKNMYISEKTLYNYVQNSSQVTKKSIMDLFPQYIKVWEYLENIDVEGYLKKQLPKRIWWSIMNVLFLHIKNSSDFKSFKIAFIAIRETPVIQKHVLKRTFLKPLAFKYTMLHILFTLKCAMLYYLLISIHIKLAAHS